MSINSPHSPALTPTLSHPLSRPPSTDYLRPDRFIPTRHASGRAADPSHASAQAYFLLKASTSPSSSASSTTTSLPSPSSPRRRLSTPATNAVASPTRAGTANGQGTDARRAYVALLANELLAPSPFLHPTTSPSHALRPSPSHAPPGTHHTPSSSSGTSYLSTPPDGLAGTTAAGDPDPGTPSLAKAFHPHRVLHFHPAAPSSPSSPPRPSFSAVPTTHASPFHPSPSSSASASSRFSRSSAHSPQRTAVTPESPLHERYRTSPIRPDSEPLLVSPRASVRRVQRVPYKVLDAPDLADDFYFNVLDWSSTNILAVALGPAVYLWSASTAAVSQLCNVAQAIGVPDTLVTSLAWVEKGSHLAIGTSNGIVQIWDCVKQSLVRTMLGHTNRTGALAWSSHILSSGSRDKTILHRDVREKAFYFKRLTGHRQEVCGLKWSSFDGDTQLASGGNDNKLLIWDSAMMDVPVHKYAEHTAAVKALAWNPHQRGVLVSGGGTQDRKIRSWNTIIGNKTGQWDTGSQVCNLVFSKTTAELVSTHGYSTGSLHNQICIWRYPTMSQVATLTGHQTRVLYLAMSPDGRSIVTGAGDETLRFWNAFPPAQRAEDEDYGSLGSFKKIR